MSYDYEELGLVAGLEIHQQLDTATKLFCNCPTARPFGRPMTPPLHLPYIGVPVPFRITKTLAWG